MQKNKILLPETNRSSNGRKSKFGGEALGIYADNSAHPEYQDLKKQEILKKEKRLSARLRAYRIKDISSSILEGVKEYTTKANGQKTKNRVWHCSKTPTPLASSIKYVKGLKGKEYFAGLQHCGSYWVCPVCAFKIAEKRTEDIYAALKEYRKRGFSAYMVTLTIPHTAGDDLNDTLDCLIKGFNYAKRGADRPKEFFKIPYVRSLEITYGKNGFHPHLHCIFILKEETANLYLSGLEKYWHKNILKYGRMNEHVAKRSFKIDKWNEDLDSLSDYLCKWKLADEVAKGQRKKSWSGYTPFQILEMIEQGAEWDLPQSMIDIYQEYARKIKGKRMLQASRTFYKDVLIDEIEDEEIIKDDIIDIIIYQINKKLYSDLVKKGMHLDLLNAYEAGGMPAVHDVFARSELKYTFANRFFTYENK